MGVINDAAYKAWLAADNKKRVVLAEVQAYSGGSLVTRYLSNYPFVSQPADTPANTVYDDFIVTIPQFSNTMGAQFQGATTPAWGDLEIDNSSGARDSWLTDDAWDGRAVTLYFGDASWAKSDFRPVMTGTIADIYAKDQRTLALKMRDKSWTLNVPVQTNLITGTASTAGNPVPLCYGQCSNVSPVLLDGPTAKYWVHDGAIQAITAVYDNGVSVSFTPLLSLGQFTLTSAPAGQITADVQGAAPAGVYLTKIADIVSALVIGHSELTSADIDATSFSDFNTTAPQTVGLYIGDRQNLIDMIDALVSSVGGWFGFSRAGLLQLGQLQDPVGLTAVASLTADDVVEASLQCTTREVPNYALTLGYQKNYTVQSSGIAGAVTADRKAYLALPALSSIATNPATLTAHPLALNPDLAQTLLASKTDADTETARQLALTDVTRCVYQFDGFAVPFQLNIGDVINLTHKRFGFVNGANAVVVGITEQPTANSITLELWK